MGQLLSLPMIAFGIAFIWRRPAGAVTPLARLLLRRIALTGPITVAEFMAEALGHPHHGYYQRRDPLGRAGDFVTAPEVSQMFGELIGLWCVEVWQRWAAPTPAAWSSWGPAAAR